MVVINIFNIDDKTMVEWSIWRDVAANCIERDFDCNFDCSHFKYINPKNLKEKKRTTIREPVKNYLADFFR